MGEDATGAETKVALKQDALNKCMYTLGENTEGSEWKFSRMAEYEAHIESMSFDDDDMDVRMDRSSVELKFISSSDT